MSGIYIPGVENLKCNDCFWAIGYRLKCSCSSEQANYDTGERPKDCPLIPVPDHGRLGDLDALFLSVEYGRDHHVHTDGLATRHHKAEFNHFLTMIAMMPTVIPTDKEAGI